MSNSVLPHRWQPTRLCHPWGFPGKSTGVGGNFLLQCMKVKRESEVIQSCLTLSDPMDHSLPGSSIHGIFQARVLKWGAIAFSDTSFYSTIFYDYDNIHHYQMASKLWYSHMMEYYSAIKNKLLIHKTQRYQNNYAE